jgi:hypothetical protein
MKGISRCPPIGSICDSSSLAPLRVHFYEDILARYLFGVQVGEGFDSPVLAGGDEFLTVDYYKRVSIGILSVTATGVYRSTSSAGVSSDTIKE